MYYDWSIKAMRTNDSKPRSEPCGYSAVVFFTLTRSTGGFSWYLLIYLFFPTELFGFVYGVSVFVFLPVNLLNIPMHRFNIENEDFATLNYVQGSLAATTFIIPIMIYRKFMRQNQSSLPSFDQHEKSANKTEL